MTSSTQPTLDDLCKQLVDVSHATDAMKFLSDFAAQYRNTAARQNIMIAEGGLLKDPILHGNCCDAGICQLNEPFILLQGDVVHTESAYFMGSRIEGDHALFAIATSTCDLTEGRRKHAVLLPLIPIQKNSESEEQREIAGLLTGVLKFQSTKYMFLPRLGHQDPHKISGNLIDFTKPHQIECESLLLAYRRASMTEVGWRIFSSVLRYVNSREAKQEAEIRNLPTPVTSDPEEDAAD